MMHRFPRDPKRRKLWEVKVKREGWKANDTSLLCEVSKIARFELGRAALIFFVLQTIER